MKLFKIIFLIITVISISCSDNEEIEEVIENPELHEEEGIYEPGDASDIEKDIIIPIEDATASEHQPGTPIENSFDGDRNNHYHSRWGDDTEFPVSLTYNFKESESVIDYLVLYPRNDGGNNGFIKKVTIYFLKWGEEEYTKFGELEFKENNSPKIIRFEDKIENPKSIRIEVTEGVNDFVSLGEIEFYQKSSSMEESMEVFEDKAATTLKPSITKEDVESIDNEFIKNMAMSIYEDTYEDFRIGKFYSYPDPNTISGPNKTSPYGIYDNVTGIYVPFGTEMVVFIDDFQGDISLRVVNHNQGFGGQDYILQPGINRFNVQTEGLAYLIYQNDDQHEVKVNFATGKVNGYFDIQKHSQEDYSEFLDNAPYSFFDVLGEYAHLTFTTNSFKNNTQNIEELIGLYDDLVNMEQDFIGLYKYDRENKTRMYFRANTHQDMYMFATSYRTEYSESTLPTLTNANSLKTSPWGPAHEVGHMNQTRPGLKWLGMTEVTTNIYSLFVQKAWGNESRIETEDLGDYNNRYEKGFSEIIAEGLAHNAHADVFCKLIPFWQLQLYLSDVKGQEDFYKDVHEAIREAEDMPTPGESQVEFVKICSDVAQMDLTGFFEKWGFLTPVDMEINDYGNGQFIVTQNIIDEAKSYIASKSYPQPEAAFEYITDSNMEVFKNSGSLTAGSATVDGNIITISGAVNAVAFQVETDLGAIKFISPKNIFEVSNFSNSDAIKAIGYDGHTKTVNIEY